MTLETLTSKPITATIFGKEYKLNFGIRNLAKLEEKYGMTLDDVFSALSKGDMLKTPYLIYCASLVFAKFDPAEPLKTEEELDLESLFDLTPFEISEIIIKLTELINSSNKGAQGETATPGKKSKKAV